MNFSGISNRTILGKILRVPLGFIPKEMVLPIIQGPLRGKRWIAGSSNHGCWLGSYEYNKQQTFIKTIKPGYVVYDIGANVGFYTLLSSLLVGRNGNVIAFEPVPRNLIYLKKHIEMNSCSNVMILPYAVSDNAGKAFFDCTNNPSMGHLSEKGDIEVETVVLDQLIASKQMPAPDLIKIDVEGGEYNVLKGAQQTIAKKRPIIFLAVHGLENQKICCEWLRNINYHLEPIISVPMNICDEIVAIPHLNRT